MKVAIVYNLPDSKKSADDLDVLVQVEAVHKSLEHLGHNAVSLGVSLNLESFQKELKKIKPDLVFNLVEAISGVEMYLHFVPVLLEKLNIPFTGASSEALFTTTNKVFTKKLFDTFNIPTPKWDTSKNKSSKIKIKTPCIVKPIYEDASVGLDDSSIVYDEEKLSDELKNRTKKYGECFVEEFIDGREFNISILDTDDGVKVLPIAEIRFEDYPDEKAKIVSYDAKWNENSFEYSHTVRHFDFEKSDDKLLRELEKISIKCWKKFELEGYARVDVRVDNNNNIFVLEINANPCISPDSGFAAAAEHYGWNYNKMVEVILSNVF
jgi:D-alanine-D-alanine ligase